MQSPCVDARVGPWGGWQSMAWHPDIYSSACTAQLPSPSYWRVLSFGLIPTSQCWLLPPERPKVPRNAQSNSSPFFQTIPAHFSCEFKGAGLLTTRRVNALIQAPISSSLVHIYHLFCWLKCFNFSAWMNGAGKVPALPWQYFWA